MISHAQRFPDEGEDKAMRILWYLIGSLFMAILVGLSLYSIFRG